jgi:hypothetical protein
MLSIGIQSESSYESNEATSAVMSTGRELIDPHKGVNLRYDTFVYTKGMRWNV